MSRRPGLVRGSNPVWHTAFATRALRPQPLDGDAALVALVECRGARGVASLQPRQSLTYSKWRGARPAAIARMSEAEVVRA